MYQLNYRSIAKSDLEFKDLDDILEESIAENSARNISGCLIYHNNCFVQILEGKKKDVLELYEKIKADDRHHSVTLLWENNVENRFFAEWHMAYYKPNDKNMNEFVDNLILLSELSDRSSSSLMSFWGNVRKILRGGAISQFEFV